MLHGTVWGATPARSKKKLALTSHFLLLTFTNNAKISASFFFPPTKPGYTVNISPFLRNLKHGLGLLGKRNSQMADNYLLTLA